MRARRHWCCPAGSGARRGPPRAGCAWAPARAARTAVRPVRRQRHDFPARRPEPPPARAPPPVRSSRADARHSRSPSSSRRGSAGGQPQSRARRTAATVAPPDSHDRPSRSARDESRPPRWPGSGRPPRRARAAPMAAANSTARSTGTAYRVATNVPRTDRKNRKATMPGPSATRPTAIAQRRRWSSDSPPISGKHDEGDEAEVAMGQEVRQGGRAHQGRRPSAFGVPRRDRGPEHGVAGQQPVVERASPAAPSNPSRIHQAPRGTRGTSVPARREPERRPASPRPPRPGPGSRGGPARPAPARRRPGRSAAEGRSPPDRRPPSRPSPRAPPTR